MKFKAFFTLIFLSQIGFSQTILQLRAIPPNPTVSDSVFLLADLEFRYSLCDLDNKSHFISGRTIVANTHHCSGIAAALCYPTDTFALGYLSPGRYTVNLGLTNGAAPVPCTPGFGLDDSDTMSFTVQSGLGIENVEKSKLRIYPNPANESITLSAAYKSFIQSFKILSITGAVVLENDLSQDRILVSDLEPGIYFIELYHKGGKFVERFIKE